MADAFRGPGRISPSGRWAPLLGDTSGAPVDAPVPLAGEWSVGAFHGPGRISPSGRWAPLIGDMTPEPVIVTVPLGGTWSVLSGGVEAPLVLLGVIAGGVLVTADVDITV